MSTFRKKPIMVGTCWDSLKKKKDGRVKLGSPNVGVLIEDRGVSDVKFQFWEDKSGDGNSCRLGDSL